MEEYIGKKCPFCKTKIEEGEAVKVCPACGIPHHEACWNENAGCTTFGCSMQNSVVNSGNTCPNCGAPLATGQSFCTKCGAPVTAPPTNVCSQCGAEVAPGSSFCTKCGAPQTNAGNFAPPPAPPVAPPPVQNNMQAPVPPVAPPPIQNDEQARTQIYVPPTAPTPEPTPVQNEAPAPAPTFEPAPAPAAEPAPVADTAPEPTPETFTMPTVEPTPEPVDVPPAAEPFAPPAVENDIPPAAEPFAPPAAESDIPPAAEPFAPSAVEKDIPPAAEPAAPAETPFVPPTASPTDMPNTIPNAAPAAAPIAPRPRVCTNCGAELKDGQSFCVQCGTPAPPAAPQRRVCSKCGAELMPNQEFCTKCGQKADLQIDANVNSAISQFNSDLKKKKTSAKKPLIIVGISVAAVITIILAIVFIPKLFASTDKYLENGEYEKAYSSAKSESEKQKVTTENAVAVCCDLCADKISDPSSFTIKNAYYDNDNGWLVLEVESQKSTGNEMEYWLFSYTNTSGKFSLIEHYDNLDKESFSVFDSTSTKTRKLVDNVCKEIIKETEKPSNMVSTQSVDRVNNLKKQGKLSSVKLISGATYKTKADSSSSYDSDYDYDDDSSYSYY